MKVGGHITKAGSKIWLTVRSGTKRTKCEAGAVINCVGKKHF